MSETRYLISEAARITQVEAHVLRYWEEELGLSIGRNKMGHRYYTDKDIRTFMNIKELKKKGLQLRAIREIISGQQEQENRDDSTLPRVIVMRPQAFRPQETPGEASGVSEADGNQENKKTASVGEGEKKVPLSVGKRQEGASAGTEAPVDKPEQKEKRRERRKAVADKPEVAEETGMTESEEAGRERMEKEKQFGQIMERLIDQLENGEKKEARYRRLDAAIRRHQQSRRMAAATEESAKKRKQRKKKKS